MQPRTALPRLLDIIEAIERIQSVISGVTLEQFEADWQCQWLVVRGLEIISEASRHLPEELKAGHPDIPWKKVAGIGSILRHNYESVAPAIIWKLVEADLPRLAEVCDAERVLAETVESRGTAK